MKHIKENKTKIDIPSAWYIFISTTSPDACVITPSLCPYALTGKDAARSLQLWCPSFQQTCIINTLVHSFWSPTCIPLRVVHIRHGSSFPERGRFHQHTPFTVAIWSDKEGRNSISPVVMSLYSTKLLMKTAGTAQLFFPIRKLGGCSSGGSRLLARSSCRALLPVPMLEYKPQIVEYILQIVEVQQILNYALHIVEMQRVSNVDT